MDLESYADLRLLAGRALDWLETSGIVFKLRNGETASRDLAEAVIMGWLIDEKEKQENE